MSFQLSPNVNENKIFLTSFNSLEGRLDPFYYIPNLVQLERKIKSKTKNRLRDFSVSHSSGATPSKSDDSYYSDAENGIPFVRVQNLSVTGQLDQSDLVYISKATHNGLLKRSQVKEHDLLVKITGVGRMAIASVAPDKFEGNINQHIVVIRTSSKEISENLAAFLNLDSIEKLASKRATGGTRPALDYPALFSIPVISNRKIYEKIQAAIEIKKQKEGEAQQSLNSIDDYLLAELGIDLSKVEENTLQDRIFYRNLSNISGGRFDPELALYNQEIFSSNFETKQLKQLLLISPQYGANEPGITRLNPNIPRYIRITDIDEMGDLIEGLGVTANLIEEQYILNTNDLLIARSGNTVGKSYLHKSESVNYQCFYAGYMIRFIIDSDKALPDYIFYYLQSKPYKQWVKAVQRITGQPNINAEEYKSLLIPIPPLKKQLEIVDRITAIRNQAKQLRKEAEAELEQAKQEVEAMILGELENEA